MELKEGQIDIDQAPPSWNFTSKRFLGDSYLWKFGDVVYISMITSIKQGKGHFRGLVRAIEASGFKVAVPIPLQRMQMILTKLGFVPRTENDEDHGEVQVWMRPAEVPAAVPQEVTR